jgi:subtilase family serine protease
MRRILNHPAAGAAVFKEENTMRGVLSGGLIAAFVVAGLASGADAQVMRSGNTYYKATCARVVGLAAHCTAKIVTDAKGNPIVSPPGSRISGYAPADLHDAYKITTSGSTSTIMAIVDAFGYDNAEADLGVYRAQWGLTACTTENGCFKKVNQHGKQSKYPDQNIGWAQESALDLDMGSAMCPNCQLILVEANDNSLRNLGASVNTGVSMGAHVVSNSYAGGDAKGETKFEADYDHAGVAVTASSDDAGFGAAFPATSPHVIAVGGTHLIHASNDRGWTETAWSGAGSGCSKVWSKPAWQTDGGCKNRMEADVSAVADPATGVAVYGPNNSGVSQWLRFGGTSVAAPLVGGIYANNGGSVTYGSNLYAHTDALFDVVSGSNGTCNPGKNNKKAYFCNAGPGYDGPTGLGTPNGLAAFGDQ